MGERKTEVIAEIHRVAWIRTVLTITGTEPQRRAFIDGFNGMPKPKRCSTQMANSYELGWTVHDFLHGPTPPQEGR